MQCTNKHFVQLPLKVELASVIVPYGNIKYQLPNLCSHPPLKVFMVIFYSFEVFVTTFLLLHLHKMFNLKWKANDSCIF